MPLAIASMTSAFGSAGAGLNDAGRRLNASAARVATLGSPRGDTVDLGQEAVEQIEAKTEFAASAKVMSVAEEMLGRLIDIKV